MNVVSGTTPRLVLPNIRVDDVPLTAVQSGEYVRYAIIDLDGVEASSGNMAHDENGDWFADVFAPAGHGRYTVVFTVKVGDKNDEVSMRLEVDPRLVPLS